MVSAAERVPCFGRQHLEKPIDVLQKRLRDRHNVLTQSMTGSVRAPETGGLRITPNVYTTLNEIDRLAAAIKASLA